MAAPKLTLSVLDQSPIPEGASGAQALHNTLDLAKHCEALGYHRYWVSEHHGGLSVAGPAPEVLLAAIGSITDRMRIGSGGVMLPHYSPFKVAEQFSQLAGLFPGRVDLGLGRASGTDPLTSYALQRDRSRRQMPDDFTAQLTELLGYLEDTLPPDHAFARLAHSLPGLPEAPEPWLLGSSPQSAIWAAQLGLPYAFADFISAGGERVMLDYIERFRPSERLATPKTSVAVWVVAADTADEAAHLALSHRAGMASLIRGRPISFPEPGKAARILAEFGDDPSLPPRNGRMITGTGNQVREQLETIAADYRATEVIVVTITHDHEARRHSYQLVADAFDLT